MSNLQNKTLPINCTGANINNEECADFDKNVQQQFIVIISVVFIILLFFLGFFVYNLIKCYLPKWRKNRFVDETRPVEIKHGDNENNIN